jgi:hypothetical protein
MDKSGVYSVVIIAPWFSTLIRLVYNLGDEQYVRWWPQFTDVVSPHELDHHQWSIYRDNLEEQHYQHYRRENISLCWFIVCSHNHNISFDCI